MLMSEFYIKHYELSSHFFIFCFDEDATLIHHETKKLQTPTFQASIVQGDCVHSTSDARQFTHHFFVLEGPETFRVSTALLAIAVQMPHTVQLWANFPSRLAKSRVDLCKLVAA